MSSLAGHFLVAAPRLPDPNFFRSVVLMVHHTDEGAVGVVLNRPSNVRLVDVWEEATGQPCKSRRPIYVGGPVEGPPMAVHRRADCSEQEIVPGVYFTSDLDRVQQILAHEEEAYRIFSGYSGWAPRQLEGELEAGGWLTLPATDDLIFADDETMWKRIAELIGLQIMGSTLGIPHVPDDASLN
jgi:putative transcriptional regulator